MQNLSEQLSDTPIDLLWTASSGNVTVKQTFLGGDSAIHNLLVDNSF